MGFSNAFSKQLISAAKKQMAEIADYILHERQTIIRPHFWARIIKLLCKLEHIGDNFYGKDLKAGAECTLCGKCVRDCPQQNISIKKGRLRFGWRCIMCMKCVYRCPEDAISPRFYRFIPIKNGYDPYKILEGSAEDP
jgi:ferredoxin